MCEKSTFHIFRATFDMGHSLQIGQSMANWKTGFIGKIQFFRDLTALKKKKKREKKVNNFMSKLFSQVVFLTYEKSLSTFTTQYNVKCNGGNKNCQETRQQRATVLQHTHWFC